MADDKWTKKALTDDSIVVALLLQIKHQQHQNKSSPSPLRWGQRQLRSKASSSKDQRHTSTTRCSPTTPLSWSAASLSDGCDTRSKVIILTYIPYPFSVYKSSLPRFQLAGSDSTIPMCFLIFNKHCSF